MEVTPPKETLSLASLRMNWNGRSMTQMKILIRMMNTTMMCAAHLICLEMNKWKHFSIFFILSSLYSLVFLYDFVFCPKESFISLFANDCPYTWFKYLKNKTIVLTTRLSLQKKKKYLFFMNSHSQNSHWRKLIHAKCNFFRLVKINTRENLFA